MPAMSSPREARSVGDKNREFSAFEAVNCRLTLFFVRLSAQSGAVYLAVLQFVHDIGNLVSPACKDNELFRLYCIDKPSGACQFLSRGAPAKRAQWVMRFLSTSSGGSETSSIGPEDLSIWSRAL